MPPGSDRKTTGIPEVMQQRQQGEPEDREVIALDTLEQRDAEAFDLVAADACGHDGAGGFEIGFEEAVGKFPHREPRSLAVFKGDILIADQDHG